jgi:hypothetical protein
VHASVAARGQKLHFKKVQKLRASSTTHGKEGLAESIAAVKADEDKSIQTWRMGILMFWVPHGLMPKM